LDETGNNPEEVDMKELVMKVIVAGEPGSGKSVISQVNDACISLRPLGVSIGLKSIPDKEQQCKMTFTTWTLTKGRPKGTTYLKGSKAAIICSDLAKVKTVKKMRMWAKSIIKGVGDIPLVFVGNNVDKAHGDTLDMIQKIAWSFDAPVVLTRLDDRPSIEEVFVQVVKAVRSHGKEDTEICET
jgi:GTPase SAR1 family protein